MTRCACEKAADVMTAEKPHRLWYCSCKEEGGREDNGFCRRCGGVRFERRGFSAEHIEISRWVHMENNWRFPSRVVEDISGWEEDENPW